LRTFGTGAVDGSFSTVALPEMTVASTTAVGDTPSTLRRRTQVGKSFLPMAGIEPANTDGD